MECPKCEADMKILNYFDDILDDDGVVREWECKCPNCGYHGKYRAWYVLNDFEWERINE